MHETGNTHDKPYRKSARPVGDVMGKYHPHGDSAIYDALVRMAQDFSMSLPLLDGQGNFGSMDGDNAAAMRYTEVRMDKPALALWPISTRIPLIFRTITTAKNGTHVLPARFPNMLVNGAGGIAVGMATNIPPHNLGEVIDATSGADRRPGSDLGRADRLYPRPRFPDGRHHAGPLGRAQSLSRRARQRHHPRQDPRRGDPQGPLGHHHRRDPLSGEQGDNDRENRRTGARETDRRRSPMCRTNPTATACAWWSS